MRVPAAKTPRLSFPDSTFRSSSSRPPIVSPTPLVLYTPTVLGARSPSSSTPIVAADDASAVGFEPDAQAEVGNDEALEGDIVAASLRSQAPIDDAAAVHPHDRRAGVVGLGRAVDRRLARSGPAASSSARSRRCPAMSKAILSRPLPRRQPSSAASSLAARIASRSEQLSLTTAVDSFVSTEIVAAPALSGATKATAAAAAIPARHRAPSPNTRRSCHRPAPGTRAGEALSGAPDSESRTGSRRPRPSAGCRGRGSRPRP